MSFSAHRNWPASIQTLGSRLRTPLKSPLGNANHHCTACQRAPGGQQCSSYVCLAGPDPEAIDILEQPDAGTLFIRSGTRRRSERLGIVSPAPAAPKTRKPRTTKSKASPSTDKAKSNASSSKRGSTSGPENTRTASSQDESSSSSGASSNVRGRGRPRSSAVASSSKGGKGRPRSTSNVKATTTTTSSSSSSSSQKSKSKSKLREKRPKGVREKRPKGQLPVVLDSPPLPPLAPHVLTLQSAVQDMLMLSPAPLFTLTDPLASPPPSLTTLYKAHIISKALDPPESLLALSNKYSRISGRYSIRPFLDSMAAAQLLLRGPDGSLATITLPASLDPGNYYNQINSILRLWLGLPAWRNLKPHLLELRPLLGAWEEAVRAVGDAGVQGLGWGPGPPEELRHLRLLAGVEQQHRQQKQGGKKEQHQEEGQPMLVEVLKAAALSGM